MYTKMTIAATTRVVTMKNSFILLFWIWNSPIFFFRDFNFGCFVEMVTSEKFSTYEMENDSIQYLI